MTALRLGGYLLPNLLRYHLLERGRRLSDGRGPRLAAGQTVWTYWWWWCALGAMLHVVNRAKAAAVGHQAASAQPHHSRISPKKLAPETHSKAPPRGIL